MSEPRAPGAFEEYRTIFGNGFDLRRLWRDRQAILADPRACTAPWPPFHYPPLRFALTLVIVPMLALAWCTTQLAGLMYPDGRGPGVTERTALAAEAPLDAWLGHPDAATFRALHAPKLSELPPEHREFYDDARQAIGLKPGSGQGDPVAARRVVDAFLAGIEAAPMDVARRRHLAAELLRDTRGLRRIEATITGLLRNFTEGGAGMQVLAALSLVVSAWLFGKSLQHDARFPRQRGGAALFLYYGTAKVFWFSVASMLAYGVIAFASASGNDPLMQRANWVSQGVAVASSLYLLLFSKRFALALRDDDGDLPRYAAASIAWRLVWTQVASFALVFATAALIGTVLGIAAAFWFMRG